MDDEFDIVKYVDERFVRFDMNFAVMKRLIEKLDRIVEESFENIEKNANASLGGGR